MSISTIRRQVKNVAYNFSDAQVKVREATSNDPWGPSTALMSEIADLTHNPMAFTEIMSIVWKRLNDSGKNWRHVYKSLVLLDFLIKCGHEKVAQQCRENVFTIETLKDFQHVEDNRDQGLNIREKAKQITSLLADDERLKNERTRFILTRNKFKQNNPGPVGAESRRSNRHHITDAALDPEYEEARPSTATEEEMQLQIALALSREECEKADEMRKSDDARLQMALEESQKEADRLATTKQGTVSSGQLTQSALDDLLSLGVGELVSGNNDQPSSSAWGMTDPWGAPQSSAPLTSDQMFGSTNDPWASSTVAQPAVASNSDPFAAWDAPAATAPATTTTSNSFDLLGGDLLSPTNSLTTSASAPATNGTRKTPENFLGENKNLVNLDNLLGSTTPSSSGGNPFLTSAAPAANPFAAQQRKSPTLNEMRAAQGQAPPIPSMAPRGTLPQANPFANPF
ncbi:Protein CBR-EPN-1 [Caenorhabditis briggsae]|uniref:Protein CBR-EPN-1 n=2 Tax=Caenorhabditis briggsae TaxID=6238 RepID=A8X4H2_CAEBR|nr:Protein CBR-EPN-1 [Caenorhabditis briggsae]UMM43854.1 hypothetical protein L5515_019182 [Caenorhabditis briggsae]CAP27532.1 Protein CBR-EPN-1 [Caenorhabditis briggsae]